MNEKIKELALDAGIGFTLWDDSGRAMIDNYTPEERLAKFALLIVGECAQVCVEVGDANSDIYPEFGNGAYFSANRVKQHFGVEE